MLEIIILTLSSFIKHILDILDRKTKLYKTLYFLLGTFILVVGFFAIKKELNTPKAPQIYFDYFRNDSLDVSQLKIYNNGNGDADSIWVNQNYYLYVDDSTIHECDLPRFQYLKFNGSTRKMFSLNSQDDTTLTIDFPCLDYYFKLLKKDFSGKLIVEWKLIYNHDDKPERYSISKYYSLPDISSPKPINDEIGGFKIVEIIDKYKKYGLKNKLVPIRGGMYHVFPNERFFMFNSALKNIKILNTEVHVPYEDSGLTEIIMGNDILLLQFKGHDYVAFEWLCDPENNQTMSDSENGKYLKINNNVIY